MLATPLVTVSRRVDEADLDQVAAIVVELSAIEVVVGLPRSLSGAEGAAAVAARDYAGRIASRVAPVPVRLVDERLTTVTAHRALARVPGKARRAVVDQAAAVEILQSALDGERASGLLGQLVEGSG